MATKVKVVFKTKISKARFTYSPYTPQEMVTFGDKIVELNFKRWDAGVDANDGSAPPLGKGYREFKTKGKYHGRGIRDLKLSNRLRRAIKTLRVNQNRGVVGCLEGLHTTAKIVIRGEKGDKRHTRVAVTFNDVLAINQYRSRMFALSPRDRVKWLEFVRNTRSITGVEKVA
jgi:hypothetical protein